MAKIRFITVTSAYNAHKLTISVDGINGIYLDENRKNTTISHRGHNNGGYQVVESCEEVLKLIKESKPI